MKSNRLLQLTGIVIFLLGLLLFIGGLWLAKLGGSRYYLLMGFGLIVNAILIFKSKRCALSLFAILLFLSCIWALWEVGLNWWQLVPRLWVWFVIGVAMLLPWWRKPLVANKSTKGTILLSFSTLFVAITGISSLFTSPGVVQGNINNPPLAEINIDQVASDDWIAFGGTNAGLHYSSLSQITPENISQLE